MNPSPVAFLMAVTAASPGRPPPPWPAHTLALGNAASQAWTWNYDGASRINGLTSGDHQFIFYRHVYSSLLRETIFRHNGTERLKTTRTLDSIGRLQSISHKRTPATGLASSSNYGYTLNDANQRTAMTQPNGKSQKPR